MTHTLGTGETALRRARGQLGRLTAILATVAVLAVGVVTNPLAATTAFAADGDDFDPGFIISDEVMFNPGTMTVDEIQEFLDDEGNTCEKGYTCLADYKATSTDKEATPMCDAYEGATKETSAEILYNVGQACGVNPQVLLVMLQKEQGLVTTSAPSSGKYKIAMGYGCPDTAPCDEEFYGFFNQVFRAAYALVRYTMPKGTGPGTEYTSNYNWFPVGKSSKIQYHPNTSCGTKKVSIDNKATASLYYYTPYVPNGAALDNLHGIGDKCSAYGNRNFWVYFTDWFGSTIITEKASALTTAFFSELLDREPTETEAYDYGFRLSGGGSRSSVVSDILKTKEYRSAFITQAFEDVIQRSPSKAELTKWLGWFTSGKVKLDTVYTKLYADPVFYKRIGGNTDEGFTTALITSVYGKEPTAGQAAPWLKKVQSLGKTKAISLMWNGISHRKLQAAELNSRLWGYRATSATLQESGAKRILKLGYHGYLKEMMAGTKYYNRA